MERRACEVLAWATFADGGWQRAQYTLPSGEQERLYVPTEDVRRLVGLFETLGEQHELQWAPAPVKERGQWVSGLASVLWVVAESKKQLDSLKAICGRKVAYPTVVLQEGDTVRHTALWALWAPIAYDFVVRANKRLAHAIGAPKKYADPDVFTLVPPGTCRRDGRKRPVLVRVAALNEESISRPVEVVGKLREAPDPSAWRDRP